jgi:hypothetical protein
VTTVTAKKRATNDLKSHARGAKRSGAAMGDRAAMSAAVAKALRNGNLWLTLTYVALILLLMKAYA